MDLTWPADTAAFRESIRRFLAEKLPPGYTGLGALDAAEYQAFMGRWRQALYDAGLLAIAWPEEYGGAGLSPVEQAIVADEFARVGAPTGTPSDGFGIGMLGSVLLRHGSDEQRARFLPRILSGDDVWCQGFSEPDAGSDLAGVQCRATRQGDEWVIEGRKLWTSYADRANWIFVLARSGVGERRHDGLTFLLVPMQQPGVGLRPIRMLSGGATFFETTLDGARTASDNVVGAVDGGWRVAMSILGFERGGDASLWLHFNAELDRLMASVRRRNLAADPRVRDQLARFHTRVQIMRFLGLRSLTRFLAGDEPGPLAAVTKIQWTEYHKAVTEFGLDLLGPAGAVLEGRWPMRFEQGDDMGAAGDASSWIASFLNARAGTIYGGTSEVQRNILAERVLGLPAAP